MGCISSKFTRTTSIRNRRSHGGFQGASVTTWEELLASHSGKDKLFSFVATKMTNSSFTMLSGDHRSRQPTDKDDDDPNPIPEASTKMELPVESAPEATESSFVRFTRSKSCQEPRKSDDVQALNNENDGINGHKIDWRDKNLAGSISFHTVEEYDALLERIRKFSTRKIDYDPWDDVEVPQWNPSVENQVVTENYIQNESGGKESTVEDQKGNDSLAYYNGFEKAVKVDGHSETGWKRKSMAKGLKTLDVSTSEFSSVGRFKQRHNVQVEGHIYSPGTYVTPKFGSYNAKLTNEEKEKKKGEENDVFSPELVAAFEDCMQQLQEEEDIILTHMDEEYSESQIDDVLDKTGMKEKQRV